MGNGHYWLHTLGCPKNEVDSDKLAGQLVADGYRPASGPADADLVVVNTCAFIEAARQESIDTVLALADARREGARLVVTGCMAERYGDELAAALPEVDLVAGFGTPLAPAPMLPTPVPVPAPASGGVAAPSPRPSPGGGAVPVVLGPARRRADVPAGGFDLLELERPAAGRPWAYVKIAEGCDRMCGFCAIPSFRGTQRSRRPEDVVREVASLARGSGPDRGVREVVLVAQDLASYGRDRSRRRARGATPALGGQAAGPGRPAPIVALTRAVAELVPRTRLLYLYPSGLTDELVSAVLDTGVPYFDLSLQHVSRPLLARMRRWGDGDRFLRRIEEIRAAEPAATFRSSFILGYPGETEEDHDELLAFLRAAQFDWAGFFPFSPEEGTHAVELDRQVPAALAMERLRECAELQDAVTAARRDLLVGEVRQVLVDEPGRARTVHEAPEIDGIVRVPGSLEVGSLAEVTITGSLGTDLVAVPLAAPVGGPLSAQAPSSAGSAG